MVLQAYWKVDYTMYVKYSYAKLNLYLIRSTGKSDLNTFLRWVGFLVSQNFHILNNILRSLREQSHSD